jgi:hypothetical protein
MVTLLGTKVMREREEEERKAREGKRRQKTARENKREQERIRESTLTVSASLISHPPAPNF